MLLSSIEDKISACYIQDIPQFTDFLTLEEADQAQSLVEQSGLLYDFFGGYTEAERRMLSLSLSGEEPSYPICILCGYWDRFGEIGHRDILGTIMATGIERKCMGDILVDAENRRFFCFVVDRMRNYLIENINRIGRCSINWETVSSAEAIPDTLFEQIRLPVSSLRIDTVIASVWHLSRNLAQELIAERKVFIDHRLVTKNTVQLFEKQAVVVRGYGKFIFLEENGLSKKGKTYILVKKYL